MVSDIEDEAKACQELSDGLAKTRLQELAVLSEATRSVFSACALVLGERTERPADGLEDHVLNIGQMRSQLDSLLRRESKRGDTIIDIICKPERTLRVYGILEKPLMYCAFALLQNGLVACYHNRSNTSRELPGRVELALDFSVPNAFSLIVRDNAGGVKHKTLEELATEQYSGWPQMPGARRQSTGMGLYIVKRLVEEHLYGQLSLRDDVMDGRVGAVFTVVSSYSSIELSEPEINHD